MRTAKKFEMTTLEQAWPEPTATHVRVAVEQIAAHFNPLRVLVFGSYARGEARPGSDLDLLVVLPGVDHKREVAVAMRRVLSGLHVPHDVFVTTPDEIERRGWIVGSLLREALSEGTLVYERAGA
jgi:uncharacterized protein